MLTLDKRKLLAVKLLFDGQLTDQQIAKRIGRSRATLSAWKKDPEFQRALTGQGTKAMALLTHKAIKELDYLLENAKSETARLHAIELVLRANGMLDRNQNELIRAKTKRARADAVLAETQARGAQRDEADVRMAMESLSTDDLRKLASLVPKPADID